ncbi:MAG: hypothetical protein BRD57_04690 [Proteobacteria bacterium SW_6_67_9]|nr:MAG: hypothetical protein BRD57_04690 [Proteobacteria bacterium SW_6_67_9]
MHQATGVIGGASGAGASARIARFGAEGTRRARIEGRGGVQAAAFVTERDRLWLATSQAVTAFDAGGQAVAELAQVAASAVRALTYTGSTDTLWAALADRVRAFDAGTGNAQRALDGVDADALAADGDGGLWLHTGDKLRRFDSAGNRLVARSLPVDASDFVDLIAHPADQSGWLAGQHQLVHVRGDGAVDTRKRLEVPGRVASLGLFADVDVPDGDGLPDGEDQCPGTPPGEEVNSDGCSPSQLDPDGDGISNAVDQCDGTSGGVVVDGVGCSAAQRDTDGDGLSDADDACASTKDGREVDDTGCSAYQLDGDNDGVVDANDACAGSKAGANVADDGCTEAERDTDGDGVPDISDPFPDDSERTVLPTLTIESPQTLTTFGRSPIQVSGTVAPSAQSLTVNGSEVPVDGEHWSAQVHLERGANTVQARMVSADGIVNTASISVVLDMAEPEVTIESHEDGETVHSQPIAVTGLVNDIVRGTVQKEEVVVQVNGQSAQVSNRSYIAEGIALDAGTNTIRVRATDQAGNPGQRKIDVTYAPPEDSGRDLAIVGGQGQSEVITGTLDEPLAVKVVGEEGQPVENKPVVFRVIRGAGTVGVGTEREGRGFIAKTDADGIATTRFKLGRRVGHGSHKVRAQVVGFEEVPVFHATATGDTPDKLSVHSGNNQRGAVHQRLPDPFVVTATDLGANVVADARVAFEVDEGGGQFPNGEQPGGQAHPAAAAGPGASRARRARPRSRAWSSTTRTSPSRG